MREIGEMLGTDEHQIWKYETGRIIPPPERLDQLARILAIDQDAVWIDTYTLRPDMMEFLVTTVEGARVVENIRTIMTRLEATQKPTTRRGVPEGVHIPIYRRKPPPVKKRKYTKRNSTTPV